MLLKCPVTEESFLTYYTLVFGTILHMFFICNFSTNAHKTTGTCINLFRVLK